MDFFKLVAEVGFPIAAACAGGYFIFLTLKFILAGVMSSVQGLSGIITALDNRVKTMNHDVIRIDTPGGICHSPSDSATTKRCAACPIQWWTSIRKSFPKPIAAIAAIHPAWRLPAWWWLKKCR